MKRWVFVLVLCGCGAGWSQEPLSEKERVRQTLRQAVADKEREAARRSALTNQTFRSDPNFVEMERRYVDGEITAKAFRKYLREYQPLLEPAPLVTNTPALTDALQVLRQHDPTAPNPGRPPKPFGDAGPVKAPAVASPQEPGVDLGDVETKMNRLLDLRKERESSELSIEHLDLLSASSGLSRRERLDLLLKMYIQSVITEPEYRAHREKLLAEPSAPTQKP